jgi:hypothetical protein
MPQKPHSIPYYARRRLLGTFASKYLAGANYRFLTPRLHALQVLQGEKIPPCQLPGFDVSVLHLFCLLFAKFRLLFSRRQKPVVDFDRATSKIAASKTGNYAGFSRIGW